MNNWKPEAFYSLSRITIDGLVLIECLAMALVLLAALWLDLLP
jgi:hypothetical protein